VDQAKRIHQPSARTTGKIPEENAILIGFSVLAFPCSAWERKTWTLCVHSGSGRVLPGGGRFPREIEDLLYRAQKNLSRLYLHALHLGEVYYITLREQGRDLADLAYSRIKSFPIHFVSRIDEELLLTAAALKAEYPISYTDSYAAALAQITNASLLTGDPEFRRLEEEGFLKVSWLSNE
jgi:predicted nucleic acid-binding protein